MRAAMGGILNFVILAVFITILGSFLFFNINYMKAYKVKNKVITSFEQFEGESCVYSNDCKNQILDYEAKIGYKVKNMTPKNEGEICPSNLGFCYTCVPANTDYEKSEKCDIRTESSLDFPFMRDIMGGNGIFQVHGETKTIIIS